MKSILKISILFLASFSLSNDCLAQNFESFLKYEGVKTLAHMAHPTNTFIKGYYTMYSNAADIEIYYKGGIKTVVRLHLSNGWVTKSQVLSDNDWFPPFLGVELIKDILIEYAMEERQKGGQMITQFEAYLGKQMSSFSGNEMAAMTMSLGYAMY